MRVFIALIVLIFSLQSWTKADDISDFEIEGMSVGDSLLTHLKKNQINKIKKYYSYPNKDYYQIAIDENYLKIDTYNFVQMDIKAKDEKYTIVTIAGVIEFPKKINQCKKKKAEIIKDIESIYPSLIRENIDGKHDADKTKKSMVYVSLFKFKSGDLITVECEDWSAQKENTLNYTDRLKVNLVPIKYLDWIHEEAYK